MEKFNFLKQFSFCPKSEIQYISQDKRYEGLNKPIDNVKSFNCLFTFEINGNKLAVTNNSYYRKCWLELKEIYAFLEFSEEFGKQRVDNMIISKYFYLNRTYNSQQKIHVYVEPGHYNLRYSVVSLYESKEFGINIEKNIPIFSCYLETFLEIESILKFVDITEED